MCKICEGVLEQPCLCEERFYVCILNDEKTTSKVIARYEDYDEAIKHAEFLSSRNPAGFYMLTKGTEEFRRIIQGGRTSRKRPLTLKKLWK